MIVKVSGWTHFSLLILETTNCSVANGVGQTALHVACLWGNIEAAQALVTAKADLNAQNNFSGASPLHCAATENSRYVAFKLSRSNLH